MVYLAPGPLKPTIRSQTSAWRDHDGRAGTKLEARESELAAVRLWLTDAEDGRAKSKAEADILRAQTAAGRSRQYGCGPSHPISAVITLSIGSHD